MADAAGQWVAQFIEGTAISDLMIDFARRLAPFTVEPFPLDRLSSAQ